MLETIKHNNLEQVFANFEIPVKDNQEFNQDNIKYLPNFWTLHSNTVDINSNLSLQKQEFFSFA